MIKNIKFIQFLLILFVGSLLFFPAVIHGKELEDTILIINQVRGTECCDPGSTENFIHQIDTLKKLNLPATFALRFDALNDSKITDALTKDSLYEPALFLEITPFLAKEAGVSYMGETLFWYKAKSAYLVGYSVSDRKKLIDAASQKFYEVFGKYPTTTVGWVIDPWSLEYLQKTYGIKVHEITREQFGTDSYTLYGGPILFPYAPSKNWALIPAQGNEAINVAIVRQTIPDPVQIFGDVTNSFTSQPNDYLSQNRDISYFEKLLQRALQSKPQGFAVIGLETSMPSRIQEEYDRQLQIVSNLSKTENVHVTNARDFVGQIPNLPSFSVYSGSDEMKNSWWVTTNFYRARIILDNGIFKLTDLRVFDTRFEDPYLHDQSQTLESYWVVPSLIDGSRVFTQDERQKTEFLSTLSDKKKGKSVLQLANDFYTTPQSIDFPKIKEGTQTETGTDASVTFSYKTLDGRNISLKLEKQTIGVNGLLDTEMKNMIALMDTYNRDHYFENPAQIENGELVITPKISSTLDLEKIRALPSRYSPVRVDSTIDWQKSMVSYANTTAIIGRNPIRIVVRLRDAEGVPIVLSKPLEVENSDGTKIEEVVTHSPNNTDGQYIIDIKENDPQTVKIRIGVDGNVWTSKPVRFVLDCKKTLSQCLMHPTELFHFVYTVVSNKFRTED